MAVNFHNPWKIETDSIREDNYFYKKASVYGDTDAFCIMTFRLRKNYFLEIALKAAAWAVMPRSDARRSMDEAPKKPSISGTFLMT